MTQTLSGTLLGFGLFSLVSAIVGGGLKALGMEVGVLKSRFRQILLGAVGAVLICASQYEKLLPVLFQARTIDVGPVTLESGTVQNTPLSLPHGGQVNVTLQRISPDFTGFAGPKGQPGQDGLYVSICGSAGADPCERRQVGQSDTVSKVLPAGPASVSVFNFATSPKMT